MVIVDKKYKSIVKSILRDNNFKKTYNIEHHGISRMEHSLKVSYYAYKIAKKFNLNYVAVARGGLLHDFYLDGDERNKANRFLDTFRHPKKALDTSSKLFNINDIEKNIIVSHMFPIYYKLPRYPESIVVNIVDKVIGGGEMLISLKYKLKYRFNYLFVVTLLFFFNN